MKRIQFWAALACAGILWGNAPAFAQGAPDSTKPEGPYILTGVEFGGTGALSPLERYADNGFSFAPYGGVMLNDWVGAVAQFHWIGIPLKDSDDNLQEDDVAWALGWSIGPRLALPMGGVEIYANPFSPGLYTGLSPHSPISDTSWGFSTGGGATIGISDRIAIGAYCKYNRLYQRAHHVGDVRFVTGGLALTVKLDMPEMGGGSSGPPPPK